MLSSVKSRCHVRLKIGGHKHAFQCQNMTEKFHIYGITKLGKQLKYKNTVDYSKPIFDTIT